GECLSVMLIAMPLLLRCGDVHYAINTPARYPPSSWNADCPLRSGTSQSSITPLQSRMKSIFVLTGRSRILNSRETQYNACSLGSGEFGENGIVASPPSHWISNDKSGSGRPTSGMRLIQTK